MRDSQPPLSPTGIGAAARRWRAAGWIIATAAAALFVMRGPVRGFSGAWDFANLYAGARCLLRGVDPYPVEQVNQVLLQSHASVQFTNTLQITTPLTFIVTLPLGLVNFPTAVVCWTLFNTALVVLLIVWLMRGNGVKRTDARAGWLIASCLVLAPFATCFNLGQVGIFVCAATVATWLWLDRRPTLAGCLLAVAIALKPTMVFPVLLYLLIRRRYRPAIACGVLLVLIAGVSVVWLQMIAPDWLEHWRANMQTFKAGGQGDPLGGAGYQLINLQRPLAVLFGNGPLVTILTWLLVGIPGLAAAIVMLRQWRTSPAMLDFTIICVGSLLIIYHRFYDATTLVFAAALAMVLLRRARRLGLLVLALTLCHFIPYGPALNMAQLHHWLSDTLAMTTWMQATLFSATAWLLLALYYTCVIIRLSRPILAEVQ